VCSTQELIFHGRLEETNLGGPDSLLGKSRSVLRREMTLLVHSGYAGQMLASKIKRLILSGDVYSVL
jgi:hypothetical protein